MKFGRNATSDYWRDQAVRYGQQPAASWTDVHAINLEIAEISKWLRDGMQVLDIGCANGFSTVQYAERFKVDINGIDYIPEMVAAAKERATEMGGRLKGSVCFGVGDIMDLKEYENSCDVAVVTRVLINLDSAERQIAAIRNAASTVRKGGHLLLSEATRDGWSNLNAFRNEWGLPTIPEPPFNRYLEVDAVKSAVPNLLEFETLSDFASTYFVGTRILKPLLAQACPQGVDPAAAETHWNRFFSMLPAAGDYGTQKLFVFRRR